jgi:hypothetical protein
MADHLAARITRVTQSWLASNPDGPAREIREIVGAEASDEQAGVALLDALLAARDRGSRIEPRDEVAADLLKHLLEAIDWTAVVRSARYGEELDDVDID